MKKTTSILLVVAFVLTALFTLVGCSSGGVTYEYGETFTFDSETNVVSYQMETAKRGEEVLYSGVVVEKVELKSDDGTLIIPATVDILGVPTPVVGVKDMAFVKTGDNGEYIVNDTLKEIVFSDGLLRVGNMAFYFCEALEKVVFPDSLTEVGDFAFFRCKALTSIDLNNVESIGGYCFRECTSLKEVIIDSETIPSIGDKTFYYIDENADKDEQYQLLPELTIKVKNKASFEEELAKLNSKSTNYVQLRYWKDYLNILTENV